MEVPDLVPKIVKQKVFRGKIKAGQKIKIKGTFDYSQDNYARDWGLVAWAENSLTLTHDGGRPSDSFPTLDSTKPQPVGIPANRDPDAGLPDRASLDKRFDAWTWEYAQYSKAPASDTPSCELRYQWDYDNME